MKKSFMSLHKFSSSGVICWATLHTPGSMWLYFVPTLCRSQGAGKAVFKREQKCYKNHKSAFMPLAELIQFSSNIITVKIYATVRTNIQARGSLMARSYSQRGNQFKHTLDVHTRSRLCVLCIIARHRLSQHAEDVEEQEQDLLVHVFIGKDGKYLTASSAFSYLQSSIKMDKTWGKG